MAQQITIEIFLYAAFQLVLVKDMKPILGVIYDFNNDDMYSGDTQF